MTSDQRASFGQRIYRALFKVFGPADVGTSGPPAAVNPNDRTVPAGYHLETISDGSGIRRRIAVQDEPGTGTGPAAATGTGPDENPRPAARRTADGSGPQQADET